jgi:hypothetical protein
LQDLEDWEDWLSSDADRNCTGPRSSSITSPTPVPRAARSMVPRDEPQGLSPGGQVPPPLSPAAFTARAVAKSAGGRGKGGEAQP